MDSGFSIFCFFFVFFFLSYIIEKNMTMRVHFPRIQYGTLADKDLGARTWSRERDHLPGKCVGTVDGAIYPERTSLNGRKPSASLCTATFF